jgi:hypothetical protein
MTYFDLVIGLDFRRTVIPRSNSLSQQPIYVILEFLDLYNFFRVPLLVIFSFSNVKVCNHLPHLGSLRGAGAGL